MLKDDLIKMCPFYRICADIACVYQLLRGIVDSLNEHYPKQQNIQISMESKKIIMGEERKEERARQQERESD